MIAKLPENARRVVDTLIGVIGGTAYSVYFPGSHHTVTAIAAGFIALVYITEWVLAWWAGWFGISR